MKTVHYFQGLQETAKLKKVASKAHAAASIPPSPAVFHPSQDPTGDGDGAGAGAGAGAAKPAAGAPQLDLDAAEPALKRPRLLPQNSM